MTTEYQGEFRYVFYTPPGRYGDTLRFYRQLGFPVVGGFSYGRYLEAGKGIIEVIDGDAAPASHYAAMLRGAPDYQAPRGGWLLVEVENLGDIEERVRKLDAEIIQPPTDFPWGFRHLTVIDPSDNAVSFFVRLAGWEAHHELPASELG